MSCENNEEITGIISLLQTVYGVNPKNISKLYSYEDRNYFVSSKDSGKSEELVLKILNEQNSQNPGKTI